MGLAADYDLSLGATAVDIDRLLGGVQHVQDQFVAFGDQLPVLLAATGIDDVSTLRAFGPFAVAVRESRASERKGQDECKCTQHAVLLSCSGQLASVGLAHFELALNGPKPLQRFGAVSQKQYGCEKRIKQGRGDQAAKDDDSDRMQNLL